MFDKEEYVIDTIDCSSPELELDEEEVEDSSATVQYPWPCPNNWPLAPDHGADDHGDEEAVEMDDPGESENLSYLYYEPSVSPTRAEFPPMPETPHRETSPLRPGLSTVRQASVVRFDKISSFSAPRMKIVPLPSPTKESERLEETDSWGDNIKDYSMGFQPSNVARSITSTTSSRRRDRVSIIETFNRKHSHAAVVERKLHFPAQFKSRRIVEATLKPWKDEKDGRLLAIAIIPWLGMLVGIVLGAYLVYSGYAGVPRHKFCQILDEDWSNGINPAVWSHEVQLGGFGTGEFEWSTDSDTNAFVKDGSLHIRPTLTSDTLGKEAVLNGYTVDLTADGSCTGSTAADCVVTSNSSTASILPPVQSARLVSKGKFSMKYGKVEIQARMPRGDWLWPAIWMLPEDSVYGPWPQSGEIDIAESRGNGISYKDGGRNQVSSTLHWGPSTTLDAYFRTNNANVEVHSDYTDRFFTYGLEWTEDYLYTYINSHLRQVFYIKFSEPFFTRGEWPAIDTKNQTAIANPWAAAHSDAAPFDQKFYLILNVAVGTSFGFFPDGVGNKPWVDGSATARADFYSAVDTWYPTWGEGDHRDMVVKGVKAWEMC